IVDRWIHFIPHSRPRTRTPHVIPRMAVLTNRFRLNLTVTGNERLESLGRIATGSSDSEQGSPRLPGVSSQPAATMTRVHVLLIAEARLAVEYLRRAEDHAAEVDHEIVEELVLIHQRLLNKIDSLCSFSH